MHTTMALKHASVEMMLGSKSQRQGRMVRKYVGGLGCAACGHTVDTLHMLLYYYRVCVLMHVNILDMVKTPGRDRVITLLAKLSGAVYCNRSCLWVGVFVCLFVGLLPR